MTEGCVVISSGAHSQLVNDDTLYKEKKDSAFSVKPKSAVDMKTSTTPFQQKTVKVNTAKQKHVHEASINSSADFAIWENFFILACVFYFQNNFKAL